MQEFLEVFTRPDFFSKLATHIQLSVIAVILGTIIALVTAVAVRDTPVGTVIAINIGNMGRAIPALALLAFAYFIVGFGGDNAIIALTALAIAPILINATTGLRQVDRGVVDAARGMGLSGFQILMGIQLPIAAPVIFAGIRTSAVQVVASATLATFFGGGGLGDFIVEGFSRNSNAILLAGSFSVAVLAIITEFTFAGLERAATPKGLKIARKRS